MSGLRLSGGDRVELAERLTLFGRVIRLQNVVLWAIRLLILGVLLDSAWLLLARIFPIRVEPTYLFLIPGMLTMMGGLVAALWRLPAEIVARRADRALGLKERLTTALELQRQPSRSAFAALQLRDTVEQVGRYEPLEAFPVRLPSRELNILLGLTIVAVGLVLVPNPMEQTVRQREQVESTIRQEAERIETLAQDLAQEENPEDFVDIRDVLSAASRELAERQMGPQEAAAALQRLEQELLAQQDLAAGELEDALASLAGSLAAESSTRDLGASLARGDLRQAARDMQELGEHADSMSPAQRSQLAQALRQAANRTSQSNQALSQSLMRSSEALERGADSEMSQALSEAAGQLERSAGPIRAASQRERALAQLQQSRGSINRSQQMADGTRGGTGQQAQNQPGSGMGGELGDEPSAGHGNVGPGEGDQSDQPGGSSAGTGRGTGTETVYDPLMTASRPDFVPGQQPFDPNDVFDSPNLDSPYDNRAQVEYKQVFTQYQERATQSLQNSYIPAGLKDIVKDYFTAITPQN